MTFLKVRLAIHALGVVFIWALLINSYMTLGWTWDLLLLLIGGTLVNVLMTSSMGTK